MNRSFFVNIKTKKGKVMKILRVRFFRVNFDFFDSYILLGIIYSGFYEL